ncbi:lectin subunit alpha-like [Musca vetustissima]|uniref:lectin subunit alpha-like n=1 Tax=Musca vetustissima TaxID=27455 RepID=UPI002AB6ED6D|nr:lectin subunit alpha-like [Musca vetustissima]
MTLSRSLILRLFAIVTLLLTVVRGNPQWHNSTDGRQYLIEGDEKYNWFQAFHECARRNLQLVEIDSQKKNDALIAVLKPLFGNSHNLWLGAMDEFTRDKNYKRPFYWSSSGKPMTFTYWSDHNPDNDLHKEHCVHTWSKKSNYLWNDNNCDSARFGYICEDHHLHVQHQQVLSGKFLKLSQTNNKLFAEYNRQQKEFTKTLQASFKETESSETEFKKGLNDIYTKLQLDISHALAQHKREVDSLVEDKRKAVHSRNVELKISTEEISKKITKELELAKSVYNTVLKV